jgi:hypothetical protein
MPTLEKWILEMADDEPVEAVVIGNRPHYETDENDASKNIVLPWEIAAPWLRYEFEDGYGLPDCHPITAWTASKVIGISTYDGKTAPFWMPRHPIPHEPEMPGG